MDTGKIHKLTQSPLGIVALFMVLVYSIAGAVMGISVSSLSESHVWVLIGFIVLFPVLLLAVFSWLVVFHYKKLYGPKDFRADDSFITLASVDEQREQLAQEVFELSQPINSTNSLESSPETINNEQINLSKEYIYAETLAFRAIENIYKRSVERYVKVNLESGAHTVFDGAIEFHNGALKVFNIKLIRTSSAKIRVQQALENARKLGRYGHHPYELNLVLVLDGGNHNEVKELERIVENITSLDTSVANDFNLIVFKLFELQEKYAIGTSPRKVYVADNADKAP